MIGYCGLGRAVDALGLRSVGAIELDFVVSLAGSTTGLLMEASS